MLTLERRPDPNQTDDDTSVDDFEADDLLLDPDPAPAGSAEAPPAARQKWLARGTERRGRLKLPKAGPRTTAAREKRIAAEIHMYGLMLAGPVAMRDDECGPVIVEQLDDISSAMARILGRYPDLADKIIETGILGDFAKLFAALWPVLKVIKAHHTGPRRDTDDDAPGFDPSQFPARPVALARTGAR